MKLLFVRHGQTDQNLDIKAWHGINESDHPLNKTGIEQVDTTRDALKNTHFDMIVTSPFLRAITTAEIINQPHGVPIQIEPDFRERSTGGADADLWHSYFDMDQNLTPKHEDGETTKEFFTRIYNAIDKLKAQYGDKTILIVAHGGVHHAFYAYANQLEWKGNLRIAPMRNAEVREYEL